MNKLINKFLTHPNWVGISGIVALIALSYAVFFSNTSAEKKGMSDSSFKNRPNINPEKPKNKMGKYTMPDYSSEKSKTKISKKQPQVNTGKNNTNCMEDKAAESAWLIALDKKSIHFFNEYMEIYPYGCHVEEATIYIEDIRHWEDIDHDRNFFFSFVYDKYIKKYPRGLYRNLAEVYIHNINLLEKAENENTIESYNKFIQSKSLDIYKNKAEIELKALKYNRIKKERRFFEAINKIIEIISTDTIDMSIFFPQYSYSKDQKFDECYSDKNTNLIVRGMTYSFTIYYSFLALYKRNDLQNFGYVLTPYNPYGLDDYNVSKNEILDIITDPSNSKKIMKTIKNNENILKKISYRNRKGLLSLINELLIYGDIFTENITEELFKSIVISIRKKSSNGSHVDIEDFYAAGFKQSDKICYTCQLYTKVKIRNFKEVHLNNIVTIESYMYSFWYRRYRDDTVAISKRILRLAKLIIGEENRMGIPGVGPR